MIKFPSMIEFIDEMGLDELHNAHKQYDEDNETSTSFSEFVEEHYESLKESWEDDMRYTPKKALDVKYNENIDIELDTAKQVMVAIVNKALANGKPGKIILEEELVPDYFLAYPVLEKFFSMVIPAVEKSLNELEG